MQEILKKFWFVILVGILFSIAIGYYVVDQSKNILKGKTVDGNDIVFEINNQDITADEFYYELIDQIGISAAYSLIERAVVEQLGEIDQDTKSEARIQSELLIENFKNQYGDDYEAILLRSLQAVGYQTIDGLTDYFEHLYKLDDLTLEYLFDNESEFITPFIEDSKPRKVSHILIAMDNPDNPTEEEQTKWDNAIAALESNETFEEVATTYSDDVQSAANNGSLGYMDANTQFVPEFLNAALALENVNDLSDWVKTSYGYHLIRLDAVALSELREENSFKEALISFNVSAQQQMIWNYAKELGLSFTGEQLESLMEQLENFINPTEVE